MRIAGRIITALVAAGALGVISAAVVGFVGGGIVYLAGGSDGLTPTQASTVVQVAVASGPLLALLYLWLLLRWLLLRNQAPRE